MKVTIVGAGNMGLAMTAYMAVWGKAQVTLFTTKDIGALRLSDTERAEVYDTHDFTVTSDPVKAFHDADITFVTYPAFLRKNFILNNQQYFKQGSFLGFVPGYGGAEYFCGELIGRGVGIFGLQRVPYVARAAADDNGLTAGILSKKKELFLGTIPQDRAGEIAPVVSQLLDIPVTEIREYLAITLAPSNPLLHITGLYNVFKDSSADDRFEKPLRFYEEWNDETSQLLFAYDEELQRICRALAPLDMSEVVPLPVYYESPTPQAMTRKLKSIEAFKAVMVPLRAQGEGFVPDLDSRMFIEDYPFGVCIFKDLALMLGIDTPTIDLLLRFYERLSGHRYFEHDGTYTDEIQNTAVPRINGLGTKDELIAFYHKHERKIKCII